jgi:L-fuconolactonase
MVTEASWNAWKPKDFYPYLDVVFESFGKDRIMFGSDWPVCLLSAQYQKVLCILKKYLVQYRTNVQDRVMGLNAKEFYKL